MGRFENAVGRSIAPRFPNRNRYARMWHIMQLDLNMVAHFPECVDDATIELTIEHEWKAFGYDVRDLT
jgi:hypothetical protein